MKLLHDADSERIVGGAPMVNISTTVNNTVGPTTVMADTTIVNKPKISANTAVVNQTNVAVQTIAFGGVNSAFSGSQISNQVNTLFA